MMPMIKFLKERTEHALNHYLPKNKCTNNHLIQVMEYSTQGSGKRLRPLLVYATGIGLNVSLEKLDAAAAAVEMIHCYSLIHDDLPAMDDDDLRRGKPTCHLAFDEATAILAGDALQCLSLEILSSDEVPLSDSQKIAMVRTLTQACGVQGMVMGQAIDVAQQASFSLDELTHMHSLKTGALITACVKLAQIAADDQQASLIDFAKHIGLGFQIQDDILDIESPTELLGKPQHSDQRAQKTTYPNLLGLAGAKQHALHCLTQALAALSLSQGDFSLLRELANQMIHREF